MVSRYFVRNPTAHRIQIHTLKAELDQSKNLETGTHLAFSVHDDELDSESHKVACVKNLMNLSLCVGWICCHSRVTRVKVLYLLDQYTRTYTLTMT